MIPKKERGVISHQATTIGHTAQKTPLEVYQPSVNSSLLVMAGQHGTEPEGIQLLSSVLRSIEKTELKSHVMLAMNPDGAVQGTRGNSEGVDLNRNFPTKDWYCGETEYRWNESDEKTTLYTGDTPCSENESKTLIKYVTENNISTVVSVHAPLSCIDDPNETSLGKWLSQEMNLPLVQDIGYPVPGSLGTWGRENGVTIITVELPSFSIKEIRDRYSATFVTLLTTELKKI